MEPLRAVAAYAGSAGAIASARDFTGTFLDRARNLGPVAVTGRQADAARLVVSELVTNAVKYAPGPCWVELEMTEGALAISVCDTAALVPVARAPDAARIGQHGLEIVLAVCDGLDVEHRADGKRVRARIALK
ncbi:ATP-binding protein [Streptomyces sp. GC420]|uniref:ATP-binding protein n=1 Tax=Streptomyces sp. GC420 TaxID=2697568 RepID=UPI0028BD765C|nr:ATP-binding protein [Streptomyces sp. GC420]